MVALAMVMDHEVGERPSEVPLTQWDQPIQTLLVDGPNKALRMAPWGCSCLRCVAHGRWRLADDDQRTAANCRPSRERLAAPEGLGV